MDRVHWPGLGHELGVGVGDSSVVEAHRLSLGKVQFPKGQLGCCYPQRGNEWILGRQKELVSTQRCQIF